MKFFVGDFETTVYEGQTETEVWASALVQLGTENVKIFNSIDKTYDYLLSLKKDVCVFYHNLKFDGEFWLYFFLTHGFKQYIVLNEQKEERFGDKDKMPNNSIIYTISFMGQWYRIIAKVNDHFIEFRDSLKLLPFSVKDIGNSFNTEHKKLEMEYIGERHANGIITDEEKAYIKNDVLVIKEALEIMKTEDTFGLTIGNCCLKQFHDLADTGMQEYEDFFPDLDNIKIDKEKFGSNTADEYIRNSYKGGWCYCVEGKQGIHFNGITLDVNSLYPSVMHSESGTIYPNGTPKFWKGNYIPQELLKKDNYKYFFIRFKCSFNIKENMLPTVQIKKNFIYPPNKWLTTSKVYNRFSKKYYDLKIENYGVVELTMTQTDWFLFNEHYYVDNLEILDGCYFYAQPYIFDCYIDKFKKIKLESKGAKRQLAKLYLNNLYGKMATSKHSSFKIAFLKEDMSIGYRTVTAFDKKTGYIAVGSAITSYAREFTIRTAQKNYYGVDKKGFIYADTDSIHCDLPIEKIKGVKIDDKNFCCWKLENQWDKGIFVRQKTYIEHTIKEGNNEVTPYYDIKCAGMSSRCKELIEAKLDSSKKPEKLTDEEIKFLTTDNFELKDFGVGLSVPSKLVPKHIKGGVLLANTTFEIRDKKG